jgi:methionyl-tRNA formyltransferase
MGTFNLHASLLPRYRGAAPIQRAVMNGEQKTGLTTFFLNDQIDTGKIILSAETDIGTDETAGELHDRLKIMGARLVLETVGQIFSGTAVETEQALLEPNPELLPKAPKIFREDCRIQWNHSVFQVINLVRGLSPYPGAFTVITLINGESTDLKIFRAKPVSIPVELQSGFIGVYEEKAIVAAASDGWIQIFTLQIPGRKVMDHQEFLRGYAHTLPKLR